MQKLNHQDLYKLEEYAVERDQFRRRVLAHKRPRRVAIGDHLNLYFEDRLTMQYQVQEMLRIEKIFEADAIQEELDSYNPLIPDGSNWKATCMLEYEQVEERQQALAQLIGIEDLIWVQISDHEKVFAIADEDLPRSNQEKTSAVHFMRFELSAEMITSLQAGAAIRAGSDHPEYRQAVTLSDDSHKSLAADLAA